MLVHNYINYIQQAYAHRKDEWPIGEQIVYEIVHNLSNRKGLDFDQFDVYTQEDILQSLLNIVTDRIDEMDSWRTR